MTTRWKRLTALLLILLTLLNAGSALAAEEFWKWGDVYEEKLILGLPTEVTDLQVFQDELYFIYGDLLLKCHEPDDTPETVYELKNLLPENVKEDMLYASYDDYRLFTDGDSLYIFVTFMQRIYRLDFEDGEVKPMLYATLDYSTLPELGWVLLEDDCCIYYKTSITGKIVKIDDKIYMLGSEWSRSQYYLNGCLISFSLTTGRGEILAYHDDGFDEVISWQENPRWASTLLVYQTRDRKMYPDGTIYYVGNRSVSVYDTKEKVSKYKLVDLENQCLENQMKYDIYMGMYYYSPTCSAFAWDSENQRLFFLHDDIAWYTDVTDDMAIMMPARGFDEIPVSAHYAIYGLFWKGTYYYMTYDDGAFVCDMSIAQQPAQ